MSSPTANCPNCGAPIRFLWSSAVQTTCEFCRSVLVRTDLDIRKVGEVADLPRDASPIQIGTEGAFQNKTFLVTGRIIYEYELGGWNEWHIVWNDGSSGWLADAQLEYDLSWLTKPPSPPPPSGQISRKQNLAWNGRIWEVTSLTKARYKGVEGELPFEYWDKGEILFADLRTSSSEFGTIDYSENPPLLFLGRAVAFDDLHLKNVRQFEGWS